MKNLLLAVSLIALISVQVYSQGKIISKKSANELFGPVLVSKEVPTENLKMNLNQSTNVVMFKIMNNDIYILNNNRDVLSPLGTTVSSSDVFSVYSISVVQELLNSGGSSVTYVEKRKEVLTITNGEYTLEYSIACPPVCP